jgi:glycerophosphoryl diester phosphodiesterase
MRQPPGDRDRAIRVDLDPSCIVERVLEPSRAATAALSVPLSNGQECTGAPFDLVVGDPRTYADLVTPAGLADIATYADGVGVCKDVLIPRDAAGSLGTPTTLIADAHDADLVVHSWTFRRENRLPSQPVPQRRRPRSAWRPGR